MQVAAWIRCLEGSNFPHQNITTLQVANTNCEPNEVVKVMGYEGDKATRVRRPSTIMLTD